MPSIKKKESATIGGLCIRPVDTDIRSVVGGVVGDGGDHSGNGEENTGYITVLAFQQDRLAG